MKQDLKNPVSMFSGVRIDKWFLQSNFLQTWKIRSPRGTIGAPKRKGKPVVNHGTREVSMLLAFNVLKIFFGGPMLLFLYRNQANNSYKVNFHNNVATFFPKNLYVHPGKIKTLIFCSASRCDDHCANKTPGQISIYFVTDCTQAACLQF